MDEVIILINWVSFKWIPEFFKPFYFQVARRYTAGWVKQAIDMKQKQQLHLSCELVGRGMWRCWRPHRWFFCGQFHSDDVSRWVGAWRGDVCSSRCSTWCSQCTAVGIQHLSKREPRLVACTHHNHRAPCNILNCTIHLYSISRRDRHWLHHMYNLTN